MRKATRVWVEEQVGRVVGAVASARVAIRLAQKQTLRMLHEAEDRANERHAAIVERLESLETQCEVAFGRLLERQTRAAAVAKHDRRVVREPERVTGLPTPAPKPGGTDTAVGVLRGEPVAVVPRGPGRPVREEPVAPMPAVVTAREAAEQLGIGKAGQKQLVKLCNDGKVAGAVLKPSRSGGWHAPLSSFKQALSEAS